MRTFGETDSTHKTMFPARYEIFKEALTRAGAALPLGVLLTLNSALNYLWIGYWMRSRGFRVPRRVGSRQKVFEIAAAEIRDRDVLYLEFGVYRGESMATWSRLLRNPKSKLHGFDSFEGLPETWDLVRRKDISQRRERFR